MKTLYKAGNACTADDDQIAPLLKNGWTLKAPPATDAEPEKAEAPVEETPVEAPAEDVVEETEEEAPVEVPVKKIPKKAPRKIPSRKSAKTKE